MDRIGFYPCCAQDIREPAEALAGLVDEIVYCDISPDLRDDPSCGLELPRRSFLRMDVRDAIDIIERIDVLFYRRDGTVEGGSGVFILGSTVLPSILRKMSGHGSIIVTDGSNSRGGIFRKMRRASGLMIAERHISLRNEQRFESLGTLEFDVKILG
jgi:hypothetical protein